MSEIKLTLLLFYETEFWPRKFPFAYNLEQIVAVDHQAFTNHQLAIDIYSIFKLLSQPLKTL